MIGKGTMLAVVAVLLLAAAASAQSFELRTWSTPGAAPSDGEPLSDSASFTMRSRLGGPFVGHAESASFALWGCGAYTPVEGSFFASVDPEGAVIVRWSLGSPVDVDGVNVYRSLAQEGPYVRLNEEPLAPGEASYLDGTVWPGTEFWYDVRVVVGEVEEPLVSGPMSVTTGGTLVTAVRSTSPNPFTEQTTIHHDIAAVVGGVRLVIYDVAGRVVRTFDHSPEHPGRYEVTWDGKNDAGGRVASGVYFCSLEAAGERSTRPIVLLR
ncbi:MAG: T9SS type A sorting domain-containing protein [Candidatus Eisenbacteria bacterium]|nr:T9SS type A sorting domain-containing protein [Candidatus Eisenbacteria bacterium]